MPYQHQSQFEHQASNNKNAMNQSEIDMLIDVLLKQLKTDQENNDSETTKKPSDEKNDLKDAIKKLEEKCANLESHNARNEKLIQELKSEVKKKRILKNVHAVGVKPDDKHDNEPKINDAQDLELQQKELEDKLRREKDEEAKALLKEEEKKKKAEKLRIMLETMLESESELDEKISFEEKRKLEEQDYYKHMQPDHKRIRTKTINECIHWNVSEFKKHKATLYEPTRKNFQLNEMALGDIVY